MQLLAAQIEKAIPKPYVFGIIEVAEHRQRQFVGATQHLDVGVAGAVDDDAEIADRREPAPASRSERAERRVERDGATGAERHATLAGGAGTAGLGRRLDLPQRLFPALIRRVA